MRDIRVKDPVILPDPFTARYWIDPTHEGVDAFDPYVEAYWVSVVGPTTFVLGRRLLLEPMEWSKADLAAAVGIGYRGGEKCPLERALARLVRFKLAVADEAVLYVRPRWPRLIPGNIARLPKFLRDHEPEMWKIGQW